MLRWEEAVHVAFTPGAKSAKTARREAPGKEPGYHFFGTTSVSYCPPAVEKPENGTRVPNFPGGAVRGPPF